MKYVPPFGATDPDEVYLNRNLGTGTAGSKVDAKFFNDLQAEIMNLLDTAGIVPDDGDLTQVYQAVLAIVAANVTPGGDMFKADNLSGLTSLNTALNNLGIFQERGTDIASAATTEIGNADSFYVRVTGNTGITSLGTAAARKWVWVEFTGTPLLTHSADLDLIGDANIQVAAGDRALFVKTDADSWSMLFYERNNGTPLTLAPHPDFTNSKAASGYQKLPNGVILQWGTGTLASGTTGVTFPIAFPNACTFFNSGMVNNANSTAYTTIFTAPTTTGCTVYSNNAYNLPIRWFAIGY